MSSGTFDERYDVKNASMSKGYYRYNGRYYNGQRGDYDRNLYYRFCRERRLHKKRQRIRQFHEAVDEMYKNAADHTIACMYFIKGRSKFPPNVPKKILEFVGSMFIGRGVDITQSSFLHGAWVIKYSSVCSENGCLMKGKGLISGRFQDNAVIKFGDYYTCECECV